MRTYRLVFEDPIPIWLVEGTSRPGREDTPVNELFAKVLAEHQTFPEYRGVEIARLPQVLTSGVDVVPTNAPIFVSDFDKAWEYPSTSAPRVVFALRSNMLKRSFQTLPLDASTAEIADVRTEYPHQHEHDRCLWFSRIAEQNRNLAYESAYGYWIPGNAKDALLAAFCFGNPDDILPHLVLAIAAARHGLPPLPRGM